MNILRFALILGTLSIASVCLSCTKVSEQKEAYDFPKDMVVADGAIIEVAQRFNIPYLQITSNHIIPRVRDLQTALQSEDYEKLVALLSKDTQSRLQAEYGTQGGERGSIPQRLKADMRKGASRFTALNRMEKYKHLIGKDKVTWFITADVISRSPPKASWAVSLVDGSVPPMTKDPTIFLFGVYEESPGEYRIILDGLPDAPVPRLPLAYEN